jgi:hypothetical protein
MDRIDEFNALVTRLGVEEPKAAHARRSEYKKRIITWKSGDHTYSRGFIFGNYGHSAADYAKLVAEARQDFPHLKPTDIDCSKVTQSSYMKGFAVVSFALPPNAERDGYDQWGSFDFYY